MANTHALDLERPSSQYAAITDVAQTGLDITGDITIEAWIKIEQLASTCGFNYTIVSKFDGSGSNRAYDFYITTNDKLNINFSQDGGNTNNTIVTQTTANIVPGSWYHVAVTVDVSQGASGVIFYVNGSAVNDTDTKSAATSIFNSNADFAIGAQDETTGYTNFFDGLIDDVRIWNDVRTPTEILNNMSPESIDGSEAGNVGYWKLNNDYTDENANSNDLTASGSPVFSTYVYQPGVRTSTIQASADIEDTMINNLQTTTNYGSNSLVAIGESNTEAARAWRTLLQFDLSSIPSNATINSAAIKLKIATDLSSTGRVYSVYRVLRNWVEGEVTWVIYSTGNNWGTAGCSNTTNDREASAIGVTFMPSTLSVGKVVYFTLDPSKIQDFIDGTLTNNGFLLQATTESNDEYAFDSSENGTEADNPALYLEYTVPSGNLTLLGVG